MNKHADADPEGKDFGTSCVVAFGSGIGVVELYSKDEVSSGDDSHESFSEHDDTSTDCDVQHCQKI